MGAFRNSWDEASTAWVGDWTCSRLISPVDRCPEVGGKDQVAPLRSIIKTLRFALGFQGPLPNSCPWNNVSRSSYLEDEGSNVQV